MNYMEQQPQSSYSEKIEMSWEKHVYFCRGWVELSETGLSFSWFPGGSYVVFFFELNKANYCEFCLASFPGLMLWFVFSMIHESCSSKVKVCQRLTKSLLPLRTWWWEEKRQNNLLNLVPQLKKICTFQKAPPTVWPHHQHTCKSKWKIYVWTCYGSTLNPVYRAKPNCFLYPRVVKPETSGSCSHANEPGFTDSWVSGVVTVLLTRVIFGVDALVQIAL